MKIEGSFISANNDNLTTITKKIDCNNLYLYNNNIKHISDDVKYKNINLGKNNYIYFKKYIYQL